MNSWTPVTLHWPSGRKVSTPSQTEVLGESERTTSIPGILFGSSVCLAVKSNFDLIRSIHQLAGVQTFIQTDKFRGQTNNNQLMQAVRHGLPLFSFGFFFLMFSEP